jgi:hypothetical protein
MRRGFLNDSRANVSSRSGASATARAKAAARAKATSRGNRAQQFGGVLGCGGGVALPVPDAEMCDGVDTGTLPIQRQRLYESIFNFRLCFRSELENAVGADSAFLQYARRPVDGYGQLLALSAPDCDLAFAYQHWYMARVAELEGDTFDELYCVPIFIQPLEDYNRHFAARHFGQDTLSGAMRHFVSEMREFGRPNSFVHVSPAS